MPVLPDPNRPTPWIIFLYTNNYLTSNYRFAKNGFVSLVIRQAPRLAFCFWPLHFASLCGSTPSFLRRARHAVPLLRMN
jgi:hypothetical protein